MFWQVIDDMTNDFKLTVVIEDNIELFFIVHIWETTKKTSLLSCNYRTNPECSKWYMTEKWLWIDINFNKMKNYWLDKRS